MHLFENQKSQVMWPFNKKNTAEKREDKIWASTPKKYESIISDAKEYLAKNYVVFITYYFIDARDILSKMLEDASVGFSKSQDVGSFFQAKINLLPAGSFQSASGIAKLSNPDLNVIILFAEHYPLFKVEESIVNSIEQIGSNVSYGFYLSFKEPILQNFGADKIENLLQKMGVKENEVFSHAFITKSIENVQKKIESKITSEIKTNSMSEWFNKNFQEI